MNFDEAIRSHSIWKMKLKSYIAKPDHSLSAFTVGADNNCDLGKWLHGEGKKFAVLPSYTTLVADHVRFHKAAAEIIGKADRGESVSEEVALGGLSQFAAASGAVVRSLMAMRSKV